MAVKLIASLIIGAFACVSYAEKRVAVSFDEACGDRSRREVTVEGHIGAPGKEPKCSTDSFNERRCSLSITDREAGHSIDFSIAAGAGPNQAEETEGGLVIRGSNGSVIDTKARVAVTGKTEVLVSSTFAPVCVLHDVALAQ